MLYSSLNVYHSAISSMHLPCEGRPVGKHPLVACIIGLHLLAVPCSLSIRGFGMQMSSYSIFKIWGIVIPSRWGTLLENQPCCLRQYEPIDHQTRHSSLSLTAKSCHARLLFPTEIHKRYCPGHKRTAFIVSAFERDALICLLQCLSTYIRRTPLLNTEAEKSPLFIFFIKPRRPVSSSSLAHWLKAVLSTAGITRSSAHST